MDEGSSRGEVKRKLVKRTRKKKQYVDCDKTCGICRTPCDNPFYPSLVNPKHKVNKP